MGKLSFLGIIGLFAFSQLLLNITIQELQFKIKLLMANLYLIHGCIEQNVISDLSLLSSEHSIFRSSLLYFYKLRLREIIHYHINHWVMIEIHSHMDFGYCCE